MNVLLAVDHSEGSQRAVAFVAEMFKPFGEACPPITLFHVVEALPGYMLSQKSAAGSEVFSEVAREWQELKKREGEQLLQTTSQTLLEAGLPSAAIQTKLEVEQGLPEARRVVAALAIIEEMKRGDYRIVVLGRRGESGSSGAFPGSVAEKVLREARERTVWVVD